MFPVEWHDPYFQAPCSAAWLPHQKFQVSTSKHRPQPQSPVRGRQRQGRWNLLLQVQASQVSKCWEGFCMHDSIAGIDALYFRADVVIARKTLRFCGVFFGSWVGEQDRELKVEKRVSSGMGREFVKSPEIGSDGIDMICERLSRQPDLYLPHALATRAEPVTQIERKDHLANLLRRDAAVFLG